MTNNCPNSSVFKAGRGAEVYSHSIREEPGLLETAVESDREEVKWLHSTLGNLLNSIAWFKGANIIHVCSYSDVVVQIVDGRNPLLFRCPDLVSANCQSQLIFRTDIENREKLERCNSWGLPSTLYPTMTRIQLHYCPLLKTIFFLFL